MVFRAQLLLDYSYNNGPRSEQQCLRHFVLYYNPIKIEFEVRFLNFSTKLRPLILASWLGPRCRDLRMSVGSRIVNFWDIIYDTILFKRTIWFTADLTKATTLLWRAGRAVHCDRIFYFFNRHVCLFCSSSLNTVLSRCYNKAAIFHGPKLYEWIFFLAFFCYLLTAR